MIQALVDKLPKPNAIWSVGDRAKWLKAAAMAFDVLYKPSQGDEADLRIEEKPSGLKVCQVRRSPSKKNLIAT